MIPLEATIRSRRVAIRYTAIRSSMSCLASSSEGRRRTRNKGVRIVQSRQYSTENGCPILREVCERVGKQEPNPSHWHFQKNQVQSSVESIPCAYPNSCSAFALSLISTVSFAQQPLKGRHLRTRTRTHRRLPSPIPAAARRRTSRHRRSRQSAGQPLPAAIPPRSQPLLQHSR